MACALMYIAFCQFLLACQLFLAHTVVVVQWPKDRIDSGQNGPLLVLQGALEGVLSNDNDVVDFEICICEGQRR